jgi:hypothetical protein
LPSVVGINPQGQLVTGVAARNQRRPFRIAPWRRSSGGWGAWIRSPWAIKTSPRPRSAR